MDVFYIAKRHLCVRKMNQLYRYEYLTTKTKFCSIFRFLHSVNQTLGTVGSLAVSSIDVDSLPVLMIIMRSRSNTEIFAIVHGNVGVNELLTNLVQAVDVFQVSVNINYLYGTSINMSCENRNKDELILALKKNDKPENESSKNKTGRTKKVWLPIGK